MIATRELSPKAEGQRRRRERERAQQLMGLPRPGVEALSPREIDVLDSYIEHGSQKMVAHHLVISLPTVKNHVSRILQKLDCISIAQACVQWDRHVRAGTWPELDRRHGDRRTRGDRRAAA